MALAYARPLCIAQDDCSTHVVDILASSLPNVPVRNLTRKPDIRHRNPGHAIDVSLHGTTYLYSLKRDTIS
jgi:hypothetical protein